MVNAWACALTYASKEPLHKEMRRIAGGDVLTNAEVVLLIERMAADMFP